MLYIIGNLIPFTTLGIQLTAKGIITLQINSYYGKRKVKEHRINVTCTLNIIRWKECGSKASWLRLQGQETHGLINKSGHTTTSGRPLDHLRGDRG